MGQRPAEKLKAFFFNERIPMASRMGLFFTWANIVATVLGLFSMLLAHARPEAVVMMGLMVSLQVITATLSRHVKHPEVFGVVVPVAAMFLVPVTWLCAGGLSGGFTVWFLFVDYFICLSSQDHNRLKRLIPALVIQAGCVLIQFFLPQLVLPLPTVRDAQLHLLINVSTVAAVLCAAVYLQKKLFMHQRKINSRRQDFTMHFVTSIANTIDTKDTYTGGHSRRVAACASAIALRMGMSRQEADNVHMVALLHDIGKIGVPDAVLNKPGKLTPQEYELIRKHPVFGGDIVKDMSMIPHVYDGVLYHHERYDGTGYPAGLKGEQIPLIARIIAVADSYDAMSTNRIYRRFIPREQIISDMISCRGTQFDPYIADVFVMMLLEGYTVEVDDRSSGDHDEEMATASRTMLARLQETAGREQQVGAINVDSEEFLHLYSYLRGLAHRYGDEVTLIELLLHMPEEKRQDEEQLIAGMADLNQAITAHIRSVDVCTRYTADSYLVLLMKARRTSAELIMGRITQGFEKMKSDPAFTVTGRIMDPQEGIGAENTGA